ncbi:MAG: hypothetical protein H6Q78_1705, partial [Candidatus Krumholzibacteriota bacterium]|nr:hypothetical protein [Candidatus Krumholzibacteriota bacterium]
RVEWYTFGGYTAWAPLPPPDVYWPDPWDPHPFHPWVVVDIHDFTRDNVGHHRMMRPVPREGIPPHAYHKRAPDIDHVEKVQRTAVPKEKISKQDVDVRRVVAKPSGEFGHSSKPTLQRMVLPPEQKSKM